MKSNIKVSVILTSYNNAKYVERAIKSVLSQTYKNLELIIADDNSSDPEVINIISKYCSHENVICYNSKIAEDNRLKTARYATQINTVGRHIATGDYFLYLADDDYYYPEMVEKMVEYVEKTGHDVVFCAQHIRDVDDNIDGGGVEGAGIRFFNEPLKRGADILDHNQVMTSKKCFDSVGGLERAGYLFYPIDYTLPLHAKMYREKSVQWNMANNLNPVGGEIQE